MQVVFDNLKVSKCKKYEAAWRHISKHNYVASSGQITECRIVKTKSGAYMLAVGKIRPSRSGERWKWRYVGRFMEGQEKELIKIRKMLRDNNGQLTVWLTDRIFHKGSLVAAEFQAEVFAVE